MKKIAVIAIFALSLCGCATVGVTPASTPSGYPINGQSAIELTTHYRFMPSFSGYYLPPGIYKSEEETADGVFFKAPKGVKSLSLTGSVEVEGGIFLPRQDGHGGRGYVYLKLPLSGRSEYFIPDDFFSAYGKSWGILK